MMDKDKILDDIFNDDPLGLLNVKPKASRNRTADERLSASFDEINDFREKHGKEPSDGTDNISERQLYYRLNNLREDTEKMMMLEERDHYGLLKPKEEEPKEINSIDDIFNDDFIDILGDDDTGLFDFEHTPKDYDRASTDFVARRKPCKDFDQFEDELKQVQYDLSRGKRKLIPFKEDNLRKGAFYVHNGVLFKLHEVNITQEEGHKEGKRTRSDGRTRCIFENGTESNMKYRSVAKSLYANGKVVTENKDKVNEEFAENFSDINEEDEESGYIYVLKSLSTDPAISGIEDLYKIGFSKNSIESRIKNAEDEPTYLMAQVELVQAWKCFNMNTHQFEQLIHRFFGATCLEVDVFDKSNRRHTPREWFIVPIDVIEEAVQHIISGEIVHYRYDVEDRRVVRR